MYCCHVTYEAHSSFFCTCCTCIFGTENMITLDLYHMQNLCVIKTRKTWSFLSFLSIVGFIGKFGRAAKL